MLAGRPPPRFFIFASGVSILHEVQHLVLGVGVAAGTCLVLVMTVVVGGVEIRHLADWLIRSGTILSRRRSLSASAAWSTQTRGIRLASAATMK
jgi:hypothetical protein